MNEQRLRKCQDQTVAHGLDGVVLMPGPNMLYISGMHTHASERPILLFVPADDETAIIIPELEAMKAEAAGIDPRRIFAWNDQDGYMGAFQHACAMLELSDYLLGVEVLRMRVLEYELLRRYAPGLKTTPAETVMNVLRLRKDAQELTAIRRAAQVAEKAMQKLLPRIQVGQTEKQIAAMLVQELLAAGSQATPFGPIVSTGPNSASPHAVPTDRPIQHGDLLVIDWGAMIDDYPSDITRTFAVGEIEPEFHRIYNTVLLANEEGKRVSRPGITGEAIDRAARDVIEKAGYGPYFIHRTGHGLGLETHEHPSLVAGEREPLPAGAVFTVEPGIYLPGRGGVRIEDDVVLIGNSHESLTTFPRELIRVG
jgi:Xaa-Pro dipeptidase